MTVDVTVDATVDVTVNATVDVTVSKSWRAINQLARYKLVGAPKTN